MATEKHIKAADRLISAIDSLERILSEQYVPGTDTLDNFLTITGTDRTEIENALTEKGLVISELGTRISALRTMRDYINANMTFPSDIIM